MIGASGTARDVTDKEALRGALAGLPNELARYRPSQRHGRR